eukprot:765937-Hanusia_phi.AAC.1
MSLHAQDEKQPDKHTIQLRKGHTRHSQRRILRTPGCNISTSALYSSHLCKEGKSPVAIVRSRESVPCITPDLQSLFTHQHTPTVVLPFPSSPSTHFPSHSSSSSTRMLLQCTCGSHFLATMELKAEVTPFLLQHQSDENRLSTPSHFFSPKDSDP